MLRLHPQAGLMVGRQFATFLEVGLINTAVGSTVIFGCLYFFDLPALLANAAGYAVGMIVSFLLNGTFTFRWSGMSARMFVRFLLVVAVAYLVNAGAIVVLSPVNRYMAQAAGLLMYVVLSFIGCRIFVFGSPSVLGE